MSVVHGQVHGTEKKDIEIMHHQIDRMDIHILKLVRRRCFRSSQMIEKNDIIWQPYYPNGPNFENTVKKVFVPPDVYIYLDKNGYIQRLYSHLYNVFLTD